MEGGDLQHVLAVAAVSAACCDALHDARTAYAQGCSSIAHMQPGVWHACSQHCTLVVLPRRTTCPSQHCVVLHPSVSLQSRRFAATLGELTGGRVGLTCGSVGVLKGAVTIAIRYSAGRQQFGPPDSPEVRVCL